MSMTTEDSDPVEIGTTAQALFDFDGHREDMLPFKQGDIITIIEMNANGWWKGTNLHGRVGIFPYSYVSIRITSQESFPVAKALYAFKNTTQGDMLTFEAGDLITVLREVNADWLYGKLKGSSDNVCGNFPAKYVEMTGEFDETAFAEETQKWESIEQVKQKQIEAIKLEKEKLRIQLQKQQLEKLAEENRKQEEAIAKQKKELEELRLLKKKQQEEQQATLKRELNELKKRAELAEKELQQAKAESALLKKFQERKDAHQSVVARQKLDLEEERMKMKISKTQNNNKGLAPGPPPLKKKQSLDEQSFGSDNSNNIEKEVHEFVQEDLFKEIEEKQEKQSKARPKMRSKMTQIMKPVYVNQPSNTSNFRANVKTISENTSTNISKLAEIADESKFIKTTPASENTETPILDNLENQFSETSIPENTENIEATESVWAQKKKAFQEKNKPNNKFMNLGRGPECKKCGKSVGIANRIKACNAIWHDACFRCSTCDKIIRNGEYVDNNEHPYCPMCHKKGFGPKGFGFGGTGLMFDDTVKNVDASSKEKKDDAKAAAQVITQSWV